ncbi:MAG: shikimate dehydrogenase [Actinobacteria bacterium]|nr:shikimate dehydrogenase [Actinomycetota bacterium]
MSSSTRVAAVIGDPVDHSLSPVMFNAAFTAAGLDWVYAALRVAAGSAAEAVAAMETLNLAGLSVTMPHKQGVAAAVHRLSPTAAALGAVNCVYREGRDLVGENTDGEGFVRALTTQLDFDARNKVCAVLGAGGAARAVVAALAGAGATRILVVGRTSAKAEAAARIAGGIAVAGSQELVADADLIVNATPVGMDGNTTPLDPALVSSRHHVADLIYRPEQTPLLRSASAAGANVMNGLEMLVQQGAIQFELWTGLSAPVDVMRAAAENELATG